MKNCVLGLVLALAGIVLSANAQDKPRVFVQGKGSEDVNTDGAAAGGHHWAVSKSRSTIDSHDESMEITKDLQKNCQGVTVTINQANADYVVLMNRESKKNRGLLRSNSQIEVANKAGDILGSKATHTVGNAAKDACNLIVEDWQAHGPIKGVETTPTPTSQQGNVKPAVETSAANPVVPAVTARQQASVTPAVQAPSSTSDSVADAARKEKQHKACLDLAKDNPAISCN